MTQGELKRACEQVEERICAQVELQVSRRTRSQVRLVLREQVWYQVYFAVGELVYMYLEEELA